MTLGKLKLFIKNSLDGNEDLSSMTNASEFPKILIITLNYLEKELETPIKIVSVGPNRKQTIFR